MLYTQNLVSPTARHAEYEQWVQKLRKLFVDYMFTSKVLQEIHCLHMYGGLGDIASCLLITAPSRAGKSVTIKRYIENFPETAGTYRDHLPILLVDVPSPCTIKTLAEKMLTKLGDLRPSSGSTAAMMERVARLIKELGVELIIFDEFQHLGERQSARKQVANTIKALLNDGLVPIVLVGLPEAESVLNAEPQLANRCYGRVRIRPLRLNIDDEFQGFRAVLKKFEIALPFDQKSKLYSASTALRIHRHTDGLLGKVERLIEKAMLFALQTKRPCIDQECLAHAVEILRASDDQTTNLFILPDNELAALKPQNSTEEPSESRRTLLRPSTRVPTMDEVLTNKVAINDEPSPLQA